MKIALLTTATLFAFAFSAQADHHAGAAADVRPGTETSTSPDAMGMSADRDTASWSDKKSGMKQKTSHSQVKEAQAALNRELTIGIAEDGRMGPETRAAVRQFQTEQGLEVTGRLDTATVQALGLDGMEADRAPASVPMDPRSTTPTPTPESNVETDSVY